MAKLLTNSGVGVFELFRASINLITAFGTVAATGSNVQDVAGKDWNNIVLRSVLGITAFVFFVIGLKLIPLFLVTIVVNTLMFWTSIVQYLMVGERLTWFELVGMIGCFAGVVILSTANVSEQVNDDFTGEEPDGSLASSLQQT